jgi:hypothetical protein
MTDAIRTVFDAVAGKHLFDCHSSCCLTVILTTRHTLRLCAVDAAVRALEITVPDSTLLNYARSSVRSGVSNSIILHVRKL